VANIQFANNASSLLAASIIDTDLSIQVANGSAFPSPSGTQYFLVALVNAAGDLEIVKCTSRTGNVLTVPVGGRGQEATSAQSWTLTVTRVELRLTKGTMDALVQKTGDTMSGDLDMNGNDIVDARVTGDTVVVGGQLVGTAVRGTENDASNEILVPGDGTRATAGAAKIMVQTDNVIGFLPTGTILLWYGTLGSIPAGWFYCDGNNGTPDLRGLFVRSTSPSILLGDTGGSATASGNTGSSTHTHSGTTGSHVLTEAEIPAHNHLDGATVRLYPTDSEGQTPPNGYEINDNEWIWEHAQFRTNDSSARFYTDDTGGGTGHTHPMSLAAGGAHTHTLATISTIPPYKAVHYIMKT